MVTMSQLSAVTEAIWLSSKYMTFDALPANPSTSLETSLSFLPTPIRSGDPLRAATISPSLKRHKTAIPYVPSTCNRAFLTASIKRFSASSSVLCA